MNASRVQVSALVPPSREGGGATFWNDLLQSGLGARLPCTSHFLLSVPVSWHTPPVQRSLSRQPASDTRAAALPLAASPAAAAPCPKFNRPELGADTGSTHSPAALANRLGPSSAHLQASPAHLTRQKPRSPNWDRGSFQKNDPCLLASLADQVEA